MNVLSGIAGLWEEIIEMSTYGPSERKMLKAQREKQKILSNEMGSGESNIRTESMGESSEFDNNDNDADSAWMKAFAAAKDKGIDDASNNSLDYDGYTLRDLLVSKWGVPLDVDFRRIGKEIYCTVLPAVGYGGGRLQSRHESELEYLMHLQGIVEVLAKYNNLYDFVAFVETTEKIPKRGTDSVPFRLNLSAEDIDKITSS